MKNSLYQQLFMPSPYNSGGNKLIHNQIRSHVIAVLNVKGTTKTFERPYTRIDDKRKNQNKFQILRDFEEVNEAFRRVKQVKHGKILCIFIVVGAGGLDNKQPKTFTMRITKHPWSMQKMLNHYTIKLRVHKHFEFIQQNNLELETNTKYPFHNPKKSTYTSTKLPSSSMLTAHNQKAIFLNPRKQYFNLPKSSSRPMSAATWKPKSKKIWQSQQSGESNCFDFLEVANSKPREEEKAFVYPKISLSPEQAIEKQIRMLRVQSKQFNNFIEICDWRQIIDLLLQIEKEEIIGEEEFALQLKEHVVHLVVMFEACTKDYYTQLQKLAEIVFPESIDLVNEIFLELETYLLK